MAGVGIGQSMIGRSSPGYSEESGLVEGEGLRFGVHHQQLCGVLLVFEGGVRLQSLDWME